MVDGIIGGYRGITFVSVSFFAQDFACIAIRRDIIEVDPFVKTTKWPK
jgi:hypothetical protein